MWSEPPVRHLPTFDRRILTSCKNKIVNLSYSDRQVYLVQVFWRKWSLSNLMCMKSPKLETSGVSSHTWDYFEVVFLVLKRSIPKITGHNCPQQYCTLLYVISCRRENFVHLWLRFLRRFTLFTITHIEHDWIQIEQNHHQVVIIQICILVGMTDLVLS